MATTLDSLTAPDKKDFLNRLAIFGMDDSSILEPDLIVPTKTVMTLSSGVNSFLRPHVLTTENLDDVKRWIGIPDRHFEEGRHASRKGADPKQAATTKSPAGSGGPESIRSAAISYIWGHSASNAGAKSALEKSFGRFEISVWPLFTIVVQTGGVLEIGAGANVLCVWKIIIHEGGQVRGMDTNLNVQCTILQKAPFSLPHPGGVGARKV